MTPLLHQKAVIVTGAGKGIGREIALNIAQSGGRVCVLSRMREDIDNVVSTIRNDGGAVML